MRKIIPIGLGLLAVAGTVMFLAQEPPANVSDDGRSGNSAAERRDTVIPVETRSGVQSVSGQGHPPIFDTLRAHLLADYSRLEQPYWRVKLLRDLVLLFQQQFPDSWEQELLAFLRYAFPDIAEDLIAKYYGLQEYEQWLASLTDTMEFGSQQERRQAMWDKRLQLFGEEAYQIWEAALKTDQFDAKMVELAQLNGTFEQKQEHYFDALNGVFGEQAVAADAPHKAQKMINFLELDNVQQDLRNMSREQQSTVLRNFRSKIRLDDAALSRWDELDAQRVERRVKGESYMAQRERLASHFEGAELDARVEALQVDVFGETDAEFIRKEERSGYYRFREPQKIGIN